MCGYSAQFTVSCIIIQYIDQPNQREPRLCSKKRTISGTSKRAALRLCFTSPSSGHASKHEHLLIILWSRSTISGCVNDGCGSDSNACTTAPRFGQRPLKCWRVNGIGFAWPARREASDGGGESASACDSRRRHGAFVAASDSCALSSTNGATGAVFPTGDGPAI